MSNLDDVKALIVAGNKDTAIGLLASRLLKDKNDVEAWLLLGELIDDPARKRDCYNQVLRLSPLSSHALAGLKELEEPPAPDLQVTSSDDTRPAIKVPVNEVRQSSQYFLDHSSPTRDSKDGLEIVGYVIGAIAVFLVILYVSISPGISSNDNNTLYVGLVLLSLIAGIIILLVSSKNQN
jgi:hypothetical protein